MKSYSRHAFSVIELLVVIGIIGILIGLLLPAVQRVRATATKTECLNNLKQIGLAVHGYHDIHRGFPSPNECLGWMALILPYMDEEPVFRISDEACQSDKNPLNNPPHVGLATVIRSYVCPADGRLMSAQTGPLGFPIALTSYIGTGGSVNRRGGRGFRGAFIGNPRLTDFTDGTSTSIIVGERPSPDNLMAGWWYPHFWEDPVNGHGPHNFLLLGAINYQPSDDCHPVSQTKVFGPGQTGNICDRYHFWSLHTGGANFLFADGSVRFIPYSVGEDLILDLASRDGGEVVELP